MTHPFTQFSPDYLQAAVDGGQWISDHAHPTEHGVTWHYATDDETSPILTSFFAGNSGIVVTLLQLAEATGDDHWLTLATKAVDHLIATFEPVRDPAVSGLDLYADGLEHTFYLGYPGQAYASLLVYRATGDQKYLDFAEQVLQTVLDAGHRDGDQLWWTDQPGILGDGSNILLLLTAASLTGNNTWRDEAVKVANRILSKAETADPRGGWRWNGFDGSLLGQTSEHYWPGFEYGTAGIGFLFARVYEETGDDTFLDAALHAAEHIRAIATQSEDGSAALVPYREPDLADRYYLGTCHGPAGTARLFYQLHKLTGDEIHKQWYEKLFQGLVQSGAPDRHSFGYWQSSTLCCGTGAHTHFASSLWAATGEERYLEFARHAGANLVGEAFDYDGRSRRWYDAFERVDPLTITNRSVYAIGQAGIVAVLIALAKATQGKKPTLRTPDDPFPVAD